MREGEDQERARNQPSGLGPADLEAGRNAVGSGLAELLARVEKAEGPDRELDAAILHAFSPELTVRGYGVWRQSRPSEHENEYSLCVGAIDEHLPDYTASLDAALALVERKLPGWLRMVDENTHLGGGRLWTGYVFTPEGQKARQFEGYAKTPALALLAALLKALIAQQEGV